MQRDDKCSEIIARRCLERRRIKKELAKLQEGTGTYDRVLQRQDATVNAVLYPVWVVKKADVDALCKGTACVFAHPRLLPKSKVKHVKQKYQGESTTVRGFGKVQDGAFRVVKIENAHDKDARDAM